MRRGEATGTRASVGLLVLLTSPLMFASGCAAHKSAMASAHAAPLPRSVIAQTLESSEPRLSAALLELELGSTPERHRRVATEYQRLGVLDLAEEHFSKAVQLDPGDAGAWDALARLWRDSGVPARGLGDAYRAVYFAPMSPAAANTLGTVLQAVGQITEARLWYQWALALEPAAAYAANNFCYSSILTRHADAVSLCERAVAIDTSSSAARNNLALAYAAAGELDKAIAQFSRMADRVAANYNIGIVYLATRDYRKAASAFAAALQANPRFTLAASRARQARLAAEAEERRHAND